MTDDAEGVKAIAGLNGSLLEGRTLKVDEASPKRERPSGGGRGQGGGRSRY
jgi:RNA recognition motif-containing protein